MTPIRIRAFETLDEFKACVELQEETWGAGFSERVPTAILRVGQILGGVSAGAYDDDGTLVGFVFGLTGFRDGAPAHWSDMLAVRPGVRDTGLGRRLKLFQREEVLRLGVRTMYWTFDPLQSRNAYLNLTKLGAVVREYRENMYGDSDSPLHRGIGTDRFVALWRMDTDRVVTRLESEPSAFAEEITALRSDAAPALGATDDPSHPGPLPVDDLPDADVVRVAIPSNIDVVKADDPDLARAWRAATRRVFTHYLAAGFEVCAFVRGARTSEYLVARLDRGNILSPPPPP